MNACFLAGANAEIHRPNESVIARADILKINKEKIDIFQHLRGWLAVFAVETVDRNSEPRVLVAFPFHHIVLCLATETVLRTEEHSKVKKIAVMLLKNMRRVIELCRNRCWMKYCGDARAAKLLRPKLAQMINWQFDAHVRELYHTEGTLARWIEQSLARC